jgi:hypothetical protein
MVVEGQVGAGDIRQIGGDVALADGDLPVLHVLRVDEQDVVDQVQVLEQDGADQAVEIAAGDKAVALGTADIGFTLSFHENE